MKPIKYFIQFIFLIFFFIIFKIIGYKLASDLGSALGKFFGKKIRTDKIIKKNLKIIEDDIGKNFDDKDKMVTNIFSNYGRILSDYMYLKQFRNNKLNKYINLNGYEHLEELKSKNKQVIFISGHFNNFELMPMFIEKAGINLAAIYRPLNNIYLNKVMEYLRIKYICRHQIKKGKAGTRELLTYLKKNFSVALMIDQRVTEGILCKLFGQDAHTTTIPAQIVKKFNCDVVPVYIERYNKVKFNITFDKPISFKKDLTIEDITVKLNGILEKMILKDTEQWILTHDRWK